MAANVNETSAATAAKKAKKSDGALKKFFKFCKKNPTFALGLAIMLVIIIVALFAEQMNWRLPWNAVAIKAVTGVPK